MLGTRATPEMRVARRWQPHNGLLANRSSDRHLADALPGLRRLSRVQWPPADLDPGNPAVRTTIANFPRRAWDPSLFMLPVIGEFVAENAPGYQWDNIDLLPGWQPNDWQTFTAAQIDDELAELRN